MSKIRWFAPLLVTAIVLSALAGCSRRVLAFTVVSSKNVSMKVDPSGVGKRTEGVDYVWYFLSIPLGTPNLKEAVDRAIESAGTEYDALTDGVIYSQFRFYLVTSKVGFKVVGTPVNTKKLMAQLEGEGTDVNKALGNVLYHSSTGRDNAQALLMTPVIKVAGLDEVNGGASASSGAATAQPKPAMELKAGD